MCWHKWSKWIKERIDGTNAKGTAAVVINQERYCEKCGLTQFKSETIHY